MPAPPAPGSSGESSGKSVFGAIAAIIGGVLTGVGVFSGWVTLGPSGNTVTDSMWSMVAGEGFLKSNDPIALVALAGGAFVVGILLAVGAGRTLMRIAAALIGLAIVVVAALNWMSISSYVTDNFTSEVEVKTAVGFYMVVVGGILTALSAILPAKK